LLLREAFQQILLIDFESVERHCITEEWWKNSLETVCIIVADYIAIDCNTKENVLKRIRDPLIYEEVLNWLNLQEAQLKINTFEKPEYMTAEEEDDFNKIDT
jgi:hypothetical protein